MAIQDVNVSNHVQLDWTMLETSIARAINGTGGNQPGSTGTTSGGGTQQGGINRNTNQIRATFREISFTIRNILNFSNQLMQPWGRADQAAADFAKSIGLSVKGMENLRKQTINLVSKEQLGALYGISSEQLIKMQSDYVKAIGRNVSVGREGLKNFAAASKLIGEDGVVEMTAKLEKFGISMEESGNLVGKMFDTSAKKGLTLEKVSKNFLGNIAMAQKYTFKDGVDGLKKMAEKAAALNMDMSQAAAFAEKVNTVEGAISTGAQLQVLGGSFAAMGNPLTMLRDSLYDLNSLQDRLINMVSGYGHWNSQNGMLEITPQDKMRIKTAAQAMGVDYGELIETAQQQARRDYISKSLTSDIQGDKKELLLNRGVVQNGEVGVYNKFGEFVNAKNIDSKNLESLIEINNSESDNVRDIAARLRGWEDSINGLRVQKDALLAQGMERSGIGGGVKKIIQGIAGSNWILGSILAVEIANGFLNNFGGGKKIKEFVDGGATKGTKALRGAGVGASVAAIAIGTGLALKGVNDKRDLNYERKYGHIKRGSEEDIKRNRWNNAKLFGGIGLASAGAAGMAASLGLLAAGPAGWIALGAVGAAAGATAVVNAVQNKNNKAAYEKRQNLEKKGMSLKGDYTLKEMKQIEKMLKDDGKISRSEFENIELKGKAKLKLQEKLRDSGDLEKYKAKDMNVEAANVIIYNNGRKARRNGYAEGGIVTGRGTSTSDSIPTMLSNGESVMTASATKMFGPQLALMNRMGGGSGNFGNIRPDMNRFSRGIVEIKPTPYSTFGQDGFNVGGSIKIDFGPIKVEFPNGASKDLSNDLLKDSDFLRNLTRKISEGLNRLDNGGSLKVTKGYQYI